VGHIARGGGAVQSCNDLPDEAERLAGVYYDSVYVDVGVRGCFYNDDRVLVGDQGTHQAVSTLV
jgi:hypothetical protein